MMKGNNKMSKEKEIQKEDIVEETVEEVEETDKEEETTEENPTEEELLVSDNKIIEELNDRIKRQMAEFENFRKRSEKEKAQMYDMGARAILEKILPVIDNFERGLTGVAEDTKEPFEQGMQMVYKQMMSALEEAGLKAILAKGETFNPDFHNAVMHEEDENYGESEVIEELQRGYTYHDSVVRHSMVKVAN